MSGRKVIVVALAILLFCTVHALGQEKKFPVKPINVYQGYSPGGAGTHIGTIVCEGMKKHLKQPVILNFKPGAAQAVAAEFVVNSKPDGYTLFWVMYGDLIGKIVKDGSELKFHLEDLDSLGCGPYSPYVLAINAESPWKTVGDLIESARKSPGKVSYGTTGVGSLGHFLGELFSMKTGIVLNHIPFTGGGAHITALLGGHTDISLASATTFGSHILPGGGMRTLVVFDQKRVRELPDVPTAVERGIDITLTSWFGMQVPKGLPKEVRAALVQAFKNTVEDPQIISMLNKLVGISNVYFSPEEVEKKIQIQYKLFQDVFKQAGLIK